MALFFIGAGTLHFTNASFYLTIMPTILPYPLALVYLSGAFEILGGIGVLVPACRRVAGYGLIALLIAVFSGQHQNVCRSYSRGNFPSHGGFISSSAVANRLHCYSEQADEVTD